MPLTDFQRSILALLSETRSPDSYLAGGAALHFAPNSVRYSNDLDFFHDSPERVAAAFSEDVALLEADGYSLDIEISQPGFIRTVVRRSGEATRIDWAHDSAWRFMPPVRDSMGGYLLHEVDLAVPFDPVASKEKWVRALEDAEAFVRSRPTDEVGCLYYSASLGTFTVPDLQSDLASQGLAVHFGAPGGVLPRPADV